MFLTDVMLNSIEGGKDEKENFKFIIGGSIGRLTLCM